MHKISIISKLLYTLLLCSGGGWWNINCIAQNLFFDGGFESINANDCFIPDEGISFATHWYPLDATPDLVNTNCPLDEDGLIFWDASADAWEGLNYVGLASRFNSNLSFISEGIATELNEPLEAGGLYEIKLAVRAKGIYQGFPNAVVQCPLSPKRHLDIYLAQERILIEKDTSQGTAKATATLATRITNAALEQTEASDWVEITACFAAQGGETHLGITMPLDDFGGLPACIEEANGGTFYTHYYDLDGLELRQLPTGLTTYIDICTQGETLVDLYELFPQKYLQTADLQWSEGDQNGQRALYRAGTYDATANLTCGNIDLIIETTLANCEPTLYIPNAFSPNDDDLNDNFAVFLPSDLELRDFQLQIYSRWGDLIFESTDIAQSWNGKDHLQTLVSGLYLWKVHCEINTRGTWERYQAAGEVTVMR